MTEPNSDDIRALLQNAVTHVDPKLTRDLWPAMSRRLDAEQPPAVWYDWALAGVIGGAVAVFPDVILVLAYYL